MTRPRDIADSINRINSSAADATAVTIDSSENVGIGLTDPDTPLEIQRGSSGNALKLSSSADGASVFLAFEQQESGTKHVRGRIRAASNGVEGGLIFETGASSSTSEVMRIDNSGRLFIGNANNDVNPASTGNTANKGTTFGGSSDPYLSIGRTGNAPLVLGRIDSDGDIIHLYGDGTTIGKWMTRSGVVSSVILDPRDPGVGITGTTRSIQPTTYLGAPSDNLVDLGDGSTRYDDIFATNGTINTSDKNEKQQIASLTNAEITAAKAISKLFKTFKWNDKVEAKGDAARIHSGVIAQDVSSAMTDAGLDATKYAFFCSDTWWETNTEVPAVEADEENGIEAVKAHTWREVFKTAEEAPEGATEKTRLGIRYPELLAFIGAATEQRLTNIEARLTALENA